MWQDEREPVLEKTLAFGLPMLARVDLAAPNKPKALVLAPTRELAAQIRLDLAPYAKAMRRPGLRGLWRCALHIPERLASQGS